MSVNGQVSAHVYPKSRTFRIQRDTYHFGTSLFHLRYALGLHVVTAEQPWLADDGAPAVRGVNVLVVVPSFEHARIDREP